MASDNTDGIKHRVINMPPLPESQIYDCIGEDGFRRLVAAFYRQVPDDSILGPMYPADDLAGAEVFGSGDNVTLELIRVLLDLRDAHVAFLHPRTQRVDELL